MDHTPKACIVCNPDAMDMNGLENQDEFESPGQVGSTWYFDQTPSGCGMCQHVTFVKNMFGLES